jgi:hypothetical protein
VKGFRVTLSNANAPAGAGKYVMRLAPAAVTGSAALTSFIDDESLANALNMLGISEAGQHMRILSVLRNGSEETFDVDISEQVASRFGWPERKVAR